MNKILIAVMILSFIAVLILLLKLRRSRKGRYRLKEDVSGLWKYHKETQFERVVAINATRAFKNSTTNSAPDNAYKKDTCIAVLVFDGDIRARQHKQFADLVDEIEINKEFIEEVVVLINSGGGMVSTYGHAFAEMERINRLGIKLTVCVDVVAASGGYLMALPADKILASAFAIIGSVGVLAFVPNFRGLLERLSIEPRTFTAGKYKRTVSVTDNASEEEVAHFKGQLEAVHRMFLSAVKKYRPQVNWEAIETGDHWTAQESIENNLGLVDGLMTSSEYLLGRNRNTDIVRITQKQNFWEDGVGRFFVAIQSMASKMYGE